MEENMFNCYKFVVMEFYFYFRLFTKMPNEHYMEVAHMLLSVAGEDIERPDEIRTAVKVNPLINVRYNRHNTEFPC